MKTLAVLLVFSALTISMTDAQYPDENYGEYKSIFSPNSERTGWFIDFNNNYTRLNGRDARMPGFAGGVVMNNDIYLGMRFKSFSWYDKGLYYNNVMPEECYLAGGFAGFYMESAVNYNDVLHLSFPVTIGGGGATYISKKEYPELDEGEIDFSRTELSASPFFVLEPGVNLEVNFSGFMKFYMGYSYRWLAGLNLENTNRNALNGSNLNIGLKFGRF
jgi:hypothetical protein